MNALAVGTPASTIAGSSAIGSSMPPRIAGLSAKSTAESDAVTCRNSPMPARIERWAAADDPVPGLLNARNVVVPPNAAATESWKKRSGSSSEATRVWVWTSTTPGSTSSPVASTTCAGSDGGPGEVRFDRFDGAAADADVGDGTIARR